MPRPLQESSQLITNVFSARISHTMIFSFFFAEISLLAQRLSFTLGKRRNWVADIYSKRYESI